jgi:N utilization substance protein A
MKGSRVQAVVQELRGEKIDIVPYNDDPARFVCNAIAPAEVSRVIIDAEGHRMELIVPDEKLSLAIGKKGQNVRLASQLTGWRIDIHSESKIQELESRAKSQMASVEGVGPALAESLFRLGWRSVADVARARPDELGAVPGVESEENAAAIIKGARRFFDQERKRSDPRRDGPDSRERKRPPPDRERHLPPEAGEEVAEAAASEAVEEPEPSAGAASASRSGGDENQEEVF